MGKDGRRETGRGNEGGGGRETGRGNTQSRGRRGLNSLQLHWDTMLFVHLLSQVHTISIMYIL